MKNIFTAIIFSMLVLASCATEEPNDRQNEEILTGSVKILPHIGRINIGYEQIGATRAAPDPSELVLVFSNTQIWEGFNRDWPEDGIIRDVPIGNYNFTISSNFTPGYLEFEAAFYAATENITIRADETTEVELELTLRNCGICFEYDESLEAAGMGNIVPVVESTNNFFKRMEFKGDRKHATLYSEDVNELLMSMECDGRLLLIGDSPFFEI